MPQCAHACHVLSYRGLTEEEGLYRRAKQKLDKILGERTQYYENADLKISLEG